VSLRCLVRRPGDLLGRVAPTTEVAGESGSDLSPHLASRQETGDRLRAFGVPVVEFRASVRWRARGFLDLLAGGVGLRRGRRDPEHVVPGDALDFWRVEAVEPDRLLRLVAEMKLPGRAWLQFEATPVAGGTEIRQTAIFDPRGLPGLLYWWALYPFHRRIFGGMLEGIARRSREIQDR
jgi:hypothetical protein